MNNRDDIDFARFARRFASIEQLVPDPPARALPPMTRAQLGTAGLLRPVILLGVVLVLGAALAFAWIGSRSSPLVPLPSVSPSPSAAVTIPPDSAAPEVVLDAYLSALRAGECDIASALAVPTFMTQWNSFLCGGGTRITSFSIIDDGWAPPLQRTTVWLGVQMKTTGIGVTIPAGRDVFVSFMLQHQVIQRTPSDAWRIFGVASNGSPGSTLPDPAATPRPVRSIDIYCAQYLDDGVSFDPYLKSRFPDEIAGRAVGPVRSTQLIAGLCMSDPSSAQQFIDLLPASIDPAQIGSARASVDLPSGLESIAAIRAPNGDAAKLTDAVIDYWSRDANGGAQTGTASLGGKLVTVLTDEDGTTYLYPSGDVLFVVDGADLNRATLTLQALN